MGIVFRLQNWLWKGLYLKLNQSNYARGDRLAEKIRTMGAFVGGIILVVLGALTLAEAIITLLGNPAFIFIDNMNRGFELVVGL